MPNKYSAQHQLAAGANKTFIVNTGGTGVRLYLCHLIIGCDDTPVDTAGEWIVSLADDAGTGGTGLTEAPLDPLSPAATGAAKGGAMSPEVTLTTNGTRLMIGLNQRATFTWWAREGFEIISAAASANGWATRCVGVTSGTANYNHTVMWYE